jgi:hypothetical protein
MAAAQAVYRSRLRALWQPGANDPLFRQMFPLGGGLELTVIGVEHGVPVVGVYAVHLVSYDPWAEQELWATSPGKLDVLADATGLLVYTSGQQWAMDMAAQRPRPAWLATGDADAARRIIAMQADETPEFVGGEIHVVTVP